MAIEPECFRISYQLKMSLTFIIHVYFFVRRVAEYNSPVR